MGRHRGYETSSPIERRLETSYPTEFQWHFGRSILRRTTIYSADAIEPPAACSSPKRRDKGREIYRPLRSCQWTSRSDNGANRADRGTCSSLVTNAGLQVKPMLHPRQRHALLALADRRFLRDAVGENAAHARLAHRDSPYQVGAASSVVGLCVMNKEYGVCKGFPFLEAWYN